MKNKKNKKEKEQEELNDVENPQDEQISEEPSGSEEKKAEKQPSGPEQELAEYKDRYVRLLAEFDNFRKRTQREKADMTKYAGEAVLTALLPVLDDFERTMDVIGQTDNLAAVKEGIQLVKDNLFRSLHKSGLEAVESLGTDFNMDLHEAIATVPVEEKDRKGKVIDEVEKGYKLNDKVIRYAKVIVGE